MKVFITHNLVTALLCGCSTTKDWVKKNKTLHEWVLRITYGNNTSSLNELLGIDKSASNHHKLASSSNRNVKRYPILHQGLSLTTYLTQLVLTLNVPCISESCVEIKIKLNFCFHTLLWCLKRFYEGLKGTTKKWENKNFI